MNEQRPGTQPRRQQGTAAAAAGIGVSRLSGLARTALVTNVLGIGVVGDAFAAAMRIPNFLQNLLGEGALSAAFVPAYSALSERDERAAGRLAGAIATFLVAVTATATLISVFAARPLVRLIAWGFVGERFELTVTLVRITVCGTALAVMSAWCLGVLNSHRRFFLAYVAPVMWNTAQIAVLIGVLVWGVAGADRATALAWGVTAGAAAQVLVQLRGVVRADPQIKLNCSWREPQAAGVIKRFGPAVAGRGVLQVSAFLDLALASLLSVGAAAAMAAAQTLYLLPLSLLGTSVAAVELTQLSRLDDRGIIADRTSQRLCATAFGVSGVVAVYLAAGRPLADAVFNLAGLRSAIADDDIMLIALVLGAYSLGLVPLVASRLCQNVLFAAGDTRTAAGIAAVRLVVSLVGGATLMLPLDRLLVIDGALTGFADINLLSWESAWSLLDPAIRSDPALPARLGAVGLALGAAAGAWVELGLLRRALLGRRPPSAPTGADMPTRTDWAGGRLFGGALARHLAPAGAACCTGLALAYVLTPLPAVLRAALAAAVMAGVHVGCGLTLRLPVARALVSQLSRTASGQRQRLRSSSRAGTADDAGVVPDESLGDDEGCPLQ
ncbi:murein biosynthesis integral membrane protein MurJ [Candidatus Poriferisodalis sp.]|uniref:murein biosynthesis integral membrane protein MurJ n=1 Tax=Candidatus Poriferisodalis sp. TaxID=3101277 RepID=UPI003B022F53